jgi:uncharacterized protein YjbI with pentapeptide repeats
MTQRVKLFLKRWWRGVRNFLKHRWGTILIAVGVLAVVGGAIALIDHMLYLRNVEGRLWFTWVGFDSYETVIIQETNDGDIVTRQQHPGKTLWNWMELLIVPFSLSLTVIAFNYFLKKSDQKRIEDQKNEQALQEYLKEMSKLLLEHNLYEANRSDDVRFVAMALTNNVLTRLDGKRKGEIIQFLYVAGLIKCNIDSNWRVIDDDKYPRPLVALDKVDLSEIILPRGIWSGAKMPGLYMVEADFSSASLADTFLVKSNFSSSWFSGADLNGANFSGSDISSSIFLKCNLEGVDFTKANLNRTIIFPKDLRKVKSLEGCIMPRGEVYDPNKALEKQTMIDDSGNNMSEPKHN